MSKLIMTPLKIRGKKQLAAALDIGYKICQLELFRWEERSIVGNIYIGKVKNIADNIRAAFVEIADGIMCYYSMDEKAAPIFVNPKKDTRLKAGDELLVQVTREGIRGKLPCVTCDLNLSGRYLALTSTPMAPGFSGKLKGEEKKRLREIITPYVTDDAGIIVRTNCRDASPEEIAKEFRYLYEELTDIRKKAESRTCFSLLYENIPEYIQTLQNVYTPELEEIITDDREIYQRILSYLKYYNMNLSLLRFYEDSLLSLSGLYSIESAVKEALSEKVWLKSGGFLVIQQTEAFVSVDVNTGKYTGRKEIQETFRKINLEAAKEIARQLRLRNLSGMILIDFINLNRQEDKEELMQYLQKCLNEDPVRGNVVDITKLNIVEVTRKKVRKSLAEQLCEKNQESDR